ncbi:hypothetical protein QJS10_CPB18g01537 [Acorus calamus]|uniref:Remorin n=1 Tax=Acorus calamus TaxID=4465 RepID=A0AAV9CMZ4_ACOCL|nr:hypothetical protein QJS10_CPB18g01537 [Acorus calamus]
MAEEESHKVEPEVPAEEPPIASAPDVAEVKSVIPPQVTEETPEDSKALAVVEKVADPVPEEKPSGGSTDRGKVGKEKAEYAEKMKNKIALIHKEAEEKRAMVEAKRGEELLKAEEVAAKYRASGLAPKKLLGWLGG